MSKVIKFVLVLLTSGVIIGVLDGFIPIAAFNTVVILVFLPLLIIGAATTVLRGIRYYISHEPLPRLLVRDMISRTGLAIPLTLIFGVRFFGPQPWLGQQPWWVLITAVPAVISVAVYAYYEIFVLDGPDRALQKLVPAQLKDIAEKLEINTGLSRNAFVEANDVNHKISELNRMFNDLLEHVLKESRARNAITDARYATDEARIAQRGTVDARRDEAIDAGVSLGEDTHEKVVEIHDVTVENGKGNGNA